MSDAPERICFVNCGLPGDQCACYREMMKQWNAYLPDAQYAAGFKAGIEAAEGACADYPSVAPDWTEARCYDKQISHSINCIRAIPVPDAPDLTLTPDEVREVREASGYLARLEVPDSAGNGLYVARTLYCNTQVTAFSVRKARAALAILDGKKP